MNLASGAAAPGLIGLLDAASYRFSLWAMPTALTAIAMAVLGVTVVYRERGSRESRVFAVLAATIGLWLSCFSLLYLSASERVALFWAHAAYLGVAFVPVAVYHFARVVTRDPRRRAGLLAFAWATGSLFCVGMTFTDALFSELYRYPWGYYPRFRWLGAPYLLFFGALLFLALRAYRRDLALAATEEQRQRSRWLRIGFAVSYFASFDFVAAYGIPLYPFGYLPVLIFILLAAWTIRRYRLVDFTPELAAREILRTVADPILVCDRDGRIQLVNPAASELLGAEERLLGRPVESLLAGGGGAAPRLREALENRRARGIDLTFSRADGSLVEVEVAVSPLIDRGAVDVGTVVVAHDLTARRRAAEELAASARQFRALAEYAPAAVFIVEGDTIVYCNRAAELMSGRHPDDLRALPFWELAEAAERDHLRALLQSPKELPEHYRRELRLVGAMGERWVDLTLTPMRGADRVSVVASAYDVHESRLAASAAKASERRWRELLESVQLAAMMLDRDGNVTYCNPYLLELVGCEIEEVIGRNYFSLFVPADRREAFQFEYAQNLEQGILSPFDEYTIETRTGEQRWIAWSSTVLRDLHGQIVGAASIGVDLTERKRAEERLVHDAFHDALTGLPNRALFIDRLRGAIGRSSRRGEFRFAVLFIDLDRFKLVNDSLGHLMGDQLLIQVGRRLERSLRPGDTIARLGGDEFTVLVEDLDEPMGASRVAERIAIELAAPFELAGNEVYTSASIGIAIGSARYSEAEGLLRDADTALHRAKADGKARHRIFDTPMHERAVEDLLLENDLRRALERNELVLWYQPIVEVETERPIGFEALVRWNHAERGLLLPESFIPMSEETGLVVPLGEWVLDEACRQLRVWQTEAEGALDDFSMTVNFSGRQLAKPDAVDRIAAALQRNGIAAARLKLEITESFIVGDPEAAALVLERIRALGCQICLDDFGTGYSSLNYLLRLPIDVLKVDRSFLSDLGRGARNADIVWAVVTLARRLGMQVVAEGVERASQLIQLKELGCGYAQGYYFSKPLPPLEAGRLVMSIFRPGA